MEIEMALSGYELEQAYDEMLDECYPTFKIGYSEFYASDVLKNCDPIMYRIGLSEYEDSLEEEEAEEEEDEEEDEEDEEEEDDE